MKGKTKGTGTTSRGMQLVVVLPLTLAFFALLLQVFSSGSHYPAHIHLHANVAREKEQYVTLVRPRTETKVQPVQQQPVITSSWKAPLDWQPLGVDPKGPKVAFCVTTFESIRQIKHWLSYHRLVGVTKFYLFVDGATGLPENVAVLEKMPDLHITVIDDKLKARHAKSRIWNETWLSAFFHKPCNHELFVLQSLNMEIAIDLAIKDNMEWILHVDTDELMLPAGTSDFSLQQYLASVPADVDNIVFPNYESLPESPNVLDPFLEVTLFKKNYDHVVSDLYFKNYHIVAHGNPNYFITYGNGKSAARVKPGLRSNGAHRFHNYFKHPTEITADEGAVLHYTYSRYVDLKSRRDRCDCAPTEQDSERCFILPFDRQAFLASSLKSDKDLFQWFKERLLWEDRAVVADLIKKGLLARTYLPQMIIKGLVASEEASENQAAAEAVAAQKQPEPSNTDTKFTP